MAKEAAPWGTAMIQASGTTKSPFVRLHFSQLRASAPVSPPLAPIKASRHLEFLLTCQLQMPSVPLLDRKGRTGRHWQSAPTNDLR